MQLHARDNCTNVVAGDGSKRDGATQPWDTTCKTGPTAYGHYGGPIYVAATEWAARFRRDVPSAQEMIQAIKQNSRGHRIGDESDTMDAELAAILVYLQQLAACSDTADKHVLFMSDCYNALRAIEETWRGRGKAYRQRAGGAKIEAINTLRTKLGRVVFIYVPSHSGVVPNAYADGIAMPTSHINISYA